MKHWRAISKSHFIWNVMKLDFFFVFFFNILLSVFLFGAHICANDWLLIKLEPRALQVFPLHPVSVITCTLSLLMSHTVSSFVSIDVFRFDSEKKRKCVRARLFVQRKTTLVCCRWFFFFFFLHSNPTSCSQKIKFSFQSFELISFRHHRFTIVWNIFSSHGSILFYPTEPNTWMW